MSALVIPDLVDVLDSTPAEIRQAAAAQAAERRAYIRLTPSEIEWLRQVRLKNGPVVSVVDFSRGGALVESRLQLKPGSRVTLEITGRATAIELVSNVLRCQLAALAGGFPVYRGACMFAEPLALEVMQLGSASAGEITAVSLPGIQQSAWQKIVVRYVDGGMLKGFTLDFHPLREQFSLWPSVNARRTERVTVPVDRLKALFFVRDFAGNPCRGSLSPVPTDDRSAGRRVEVTFLDGEVVRGTTLSYRRDGTGFFLTPSDSSDNNQRVFVVNAAVRSVRFP
jgi:hypothetical protein